MIIVLDNICGAIIYRNFRISNKPQIRKLYG